MYLNIYKFILLHEGITIDTKEGFPDGFFEVFIDKCGIFRKLTIIMMKYPTHANRDNTSEIYIIICIFFASLFFICICSFSP